MSCAPNIENHRVEDPCPPDLQLGSCRRPPPTSLCAALVALLLLSLIPAQDTLIRECDPVPGVPSGKRFSVECDELGVVWLGGVGSVTRWQENRVQTFDLPVAPGRLRARASLPLQRFAVTVFCTLRPSEGELWVGTGAGIYCLDPRSGAPLAVPQLCDEDVSSCIYDLEWVPGVGILALTSTGVFRVQRSALPVRVPLDAWLAAGGHSGVGGRFLRIRAVGPQRALLASRCNLFLLDLQAEHLAPLPAGPARGIRGVNVISAWGTEPEAFLVASRRELWCVRVGVSQGGRVEVLEVDTGVESKRGCNWSATVTPDGLLVRNNGRSELEVFEARLGPDDASVSRLGRFAYDSPVQSVCVDTSGVLWVATLTGAMRLPLHLRSSLASPGEWGLRAAGIPSAVLGSGALVVLHDEELWLRTDVKLFDRSMKRGAWRRKAAVPGMSHLRLLADDHVLLYGNGGLAVCEIDQDALLEYLLREPVRDVAVSGGAIAALTEASVYEWTRDRDRVLVLHHGRSLGRHASLAALRPGAVLLCLDLSDLLEADLIEGQVRAHGPRLAARVYDSEVVDGRIYLASDRGLLWMSSLDAEPRPLPGSDQVAPDTTRELVVDARMGLWVRTDQGLQWLDTEHLRVIALQSAPVVPFSARHSRCLGQQAGGGCLLAAGDRIRVFRIPHRILRDPMLRPKLLLPRVVGEERVYRWARSGSDALRVAWNSGCRPANASWVAIREVDGREQRVPVKTDSSGALVVPRLDNHAFELRMVYGLTQHGSPEETSLGRVEITGRATARSEEPALRVSPTVVVVLVLLSILVTGLLYLRFLRSSRLRMILHDVSGPLSAMEMLTQGMSASVTSSRSDEERHRHLLQLMRDGLKRVRESLSSEFGPDPCPMGVGAAGADLRTCLEQAMAGVRIYTAVTRQSMVLAIPEAEIVVRMGEDDLSSLLYNLISNACRHSPPLSEVVVSIRSRDSFAVLCIADQAPPLPEDFFSGSFSCSNPASGRQIVQEICRRWGCRIRVRSCADRKVVKLCLPLLNSGKVEISQAAPREIPV